MPRLLPIKTGLLPPKLTDQGKVYSLFEVTSAPVKDISQSHPLVCALSLQAQLINHNVGSAVSHCSSACVKIQASANLQWSMRQFKTLEMKGPVADYECKAKILKTSKTFSLALPVTLSLITTSKFSDSLGARLDFPPSCVLVGIVSSNSASSGRSEEGFAFFCEVVSWRLWQLVSSP